MKLGLIERINLQNAFVMKVNSLGHLEESGLEFVHLVRCVKLPHTRCWRKHTAKPSTSILLRSQPLLSQKLPSSHSVFLPICFDLCEVIATQFLDSLKGQNQLLDRPFYAQCVRKRSLWNFRRRVKLIQHFLYCLCLMMSVPNGASTVFTPTHKGRVSAVSFNTYEQHFYISTRASAVAAMVDWRGHHLFDKIKLTSNNKERLHKHSSREG